MLDASTNKRQPRLLSEITQLRPALARLPRIPDLLTTANLLCGLASTYLALHGELTIACWLLFIAAFFDVLDGLAARALGGGSELGKQLDSLADMVSFGVAPGFIVTATVGAFLSGAVATPGPFGPQAPALLLGLFIPVAAAWRLAKFNIDPRQSHGFLGLPTPANALFWAGLVLGSDKLPAMGPGTPLFSWGLVLLAPVLSILMLSELPLLSLKFRNMRWRGNEVVYLLTLVGAALVVAFGFLAVPLLVIVYLLSPLWGKLFPKPE